MRRNIFSELLFFFFRRSRQLFACVPRKRDGIKNYCVHVFHSYVPVFLHIPLALVLIVHVSFRLCIMLVSRPSWCIHLRMLCQECIKLKWIVCICMYVHICGVKVQNISLPLHASPWETCKEETDCEILAYHNARFCWKMQAVQWPVWFCFQSRVVKVQLILSQNLFFVWFLFFQHWTWCMKLLCYCAVMWHCNIRIILVTFSMINTYVLTP